MRKFALLIVFALTVNACGEGASVSSSTTTTQLVTTTSSAPTTTTSTTTTSTTTTTVVETTTTTEAVVKTFRWMGQTAEAGFATRVPLIEFVDPGIRQATLFVSPISEPYLIPELYGVEDVWATDFFVGNDNIGDPIIIILVWGGEDWTTSTMTPSSSSLPNDPTPGAAPKEARYIPLYTGGVSRTPVTGWLYPVIIQFGTNAIIDSCGSESWCVFYRELFANNAVIADSLESGLRPPDGLMGFISLIVTFQHYGS